MADGWFGGGGSTTFEGPTGSGGGWFGGSSGGGLHLGAQGPAPASHGGGGWFGSGLLHGAENFGKDLGIGVAHAGVAFAKTDYQFVTDPVHSFEHPLSNPAYETVAKPIGLAYKQKYGAVFEHPFSLHSYEEVGHNVAKDPFGSFLDALTIATVPFTLGGSAAIRGGTLAARLGYIADASRLDEIAALPASERAAAFAAAGRGGKFKLLEKAYITSRAARLPITRTVRLTGSLGDDQIAFSEHAYQIDPARTPWGKAIQRGYHSLIESTTALPKLEQGISGSRFGAGYKVLQQQRGAIDAAKVKNADVLSAFDKTITTNAAEHVALRVIAEAPREVHVGDWLKVRVDFYRHELTKVTGATEKAGIRKQLAELGFDVKRGVTTKRYDQLQKIITQPTPKFLNFVEKARAVSEATNKALPFSSPEQYARRGLMPSEIMAGSRFQRIGAKVVGYTQKRANFVEARNRYANALLSGDSTRIESAREELKHARTVPGKKVPMVRPAENGFTKSDRANAFKGYLIGGKHPYGDNFAMSHFGPRANRAARVANRISSAQYPVAQTMRKFDVQRLNTGLNFLTGRYFNSPEVLTRAGIQAFRLDAAKMFRDWLYEQSVPIPRTTEGVKLIPKGYRPVLSKVGPTVSGQRDLMETSLKASQLQDVVGRFVKDSFPEAESEGAKAADRMVPELFVSALEQEFKSNGLLLNTLSSVNSIWRYVVLRLRPAWALRNILSQHFLYHLNNLSPAGMVNMLATLKPELGERRWGMLASKMLGNKTIRSQWGRMVDEAGVHGLDRGTTRLADTGGVKFAKQSQFAADHPKTSTISQYAKDALIMKPVASFNTHLNEIVADRVPNMAQFRKELNRSPARVRAWEKMQNVAKAADENVSLFRKMLGPSSSDVLREATPEELQQMVRNVKRITGDWNTLGPIEKRYLRLAIPFYQFFKTMTGIIMHLGVDSPIRLAYLNALEGAARKDGWDLDASLPSWLKGSIAIGPERNGIQPMIDMQTTNHFNAPVQVFDTLSAGFTGQAPGTGNELYGPLVDMAVIGLGGVNPQTGQPYKGTGAGLPPWERALVGEAANLPPATLFQQLLGGDKIPGTNVEIGAPYPSKTYANTPKENLFDFVFGPYKRVNMYQAKQYAEEGR